MEMGNLDVSVFYVFVCAILVLTAEVCLCQRLPSGQCPCFVLSDGKCLSYDSRYLAADLEEAIVSFPDLSLMDPPNPVDAKDSSTHHDHCATAECRSCQAAIRERLNQIGLTNSAPSESTWKATPEVNCSRYRFCQHGKLHDEMEDSSEHEDMDECSTCNAQTTTAGSEGATGTHTHSEHHDHGGMQATDNNAVMMGMNGRGPGPKNGPRVGSRRKRQSSSAAGEATVLGRRFNISCTAKASLQDMTGALSLCSSCWVWRQLPPGYFPQFVNELICDDRDNICLSGYGACEPGLRTQDIMWNNSGVLTTMTLASGTYCECKVQRSSALFGLVVGDGISQQLAPIQT